MQFLPLIARGFNKRPDVQYRARTIASRLAATADLVGFNEVFDLEARALLADGFRARWRERCHVLVHPRPKSKINGGLLLVSRRPLLETHAMHYSRSSSPRRHGIFADGFAAKGALHARVWLGGPAARPLLVDVFVTHLEARDAAIRRTQYDELGAFMRRHGSPERPSLLLGDLNTRGGTAELADPRAPYHAMMRALNHARRLALVDLWPALNQRMIGTSDQFRADGGRRIDYILAAVPAALRPRFRAKQLAVNPHRDERVGALSDHSAVEGTFGWQAR